MLTRALSTPRFPLSSHSRSQRRLWSGTILWLLGAALTLELSGCEKDKTQGTLQESAARDELKKQKLQALLREGGLDPGTLPSGSPSEESASPLTPAPGQAAPSDGSSPPPAAKAKGVNAPGGGVPESLASEGIRIEMLSTGKDPKKPLRYEFRTGRTRAFRLDIAVAVERAIDGQLAPGVPALTLSVKGKVKTLSLDEGVAKREVTFSELVPSISGVPHEILLQIQQQYAPLSGISLLESVNSQGAVLGVNFDQRVIEPQVLALMQQLQDGMTNAYLTLPDEPVGPGARWIARTEMGAAGITLDQRSEVHLLSLEGSRGEFEMKLSQKAKTTKITGADLPPGVEMEVSKVDGKGSGTMSVDFQKLLVSSQIRLTTEMEAKVTEPGAPAPALQSSTTSVKAEVSLTD